MRDRQGAAPDLHRFFNPASVALVGATEDLSKFGGRCLRLLLDFGFAGRIYPINPKYDRIAGTACYPSVAALPEAPDHVGIVVPAPAVLPTLRQCAERGARFATVFTAGFAETGTEAGRAQQAEISAFCAASGLRVMGPNCNGLINFRDGFALTSTASVTRAAGQARQCRHRLAQRRAGPGQRDVAGAAGRRADRLRGQLRQ